MNPHRTVPTAFLYEKIAGEIRSQIRTGTLVPGDKLPSVRRLSTQRGVGISTVLQAYVILEGELMVEARPQSGYYVALNLRKRLPEPVDHTPASEPSLIGVSDFVSKLFEANREPDMIPLGASCTSPDLMPTAKLVKILNRLSRDHNEMLGRYNFQAADPAYARQISRRYYQHGCRLNPGEIVATTGCTEAFNLCLRAVARAGDTIAVESPTYYGILEIIESLNMKAAAICTDPRRGICPEELRDALEEHDVKACVLMPNFQNPLGYCMDSERKKTVLEILDDYGVPLIEDDIYGDIYFEGRRPEPFKALDTTGAVMLCSSFSKTISPGLRLGWVAGGSYFERIMRLKFINTMGTPEIFQKTMAQYLENGGFDRHLRKLRRIFKEQVNHTAKAAFDYFPEGTLITRPKGGSFLWVQLPLEVDTLELFRRALEEKIVIAPGPLFSANCCRSCIRLNCGFPWNERMENAMRVLGRLIREMLKSRNM